MTPRTKIQKDAWMLHGRLPQLTELQRGWAELNLFDRTGIYKKGRAYCLECGHEWDANDSELACRTLGVTCPRCGRALAMKISPNRKREHCDTQIMTIVDTMEQYQVTRQFYVFKYTKLGSAASYTMLEATQMWYDASTKATAALARPKSTGFYVDNYRYNEPLRVMDPNAQGHEYDMDGTVCPNPRILPELRKRGLSKRALDKLGPNAIIKGVLQYTQVETLVKAGRYDLLLSLDTIEIRVYWKQIKIAMRHHYKVADGGMWVDCFRMMGPLGIDMNNPKYVCPKSIRKWHNELMRMTSKAERKRIKEKERKMVLAMEAENEQFIERCNRYFDIAIEVGDITIRPLRSIAEFVEEGEKQHICVGTPEQSYWKRQNSLVMSARIGDKIIATIELDLTTYRVKQCRSVANGHPAEYDVLVKAIEDSKPIFAKAKRSA